MNDPPTSAVGCTEAPALPDRAEYERSTDSVGGIPETPGLPLIWPGCERSTDSDCGAAWLQSVSNDRSSGGPLSL